MNDSLSDPIIKADEYYDPYDYSVARRSDASFMDSAVDYANHKERQRRVLGMLAMAGKALLKPLITKGIKWGAKKLFKYGARKLGKYAARRMGGRRRGKYRRPSVRTFRRRPSGRTFLQRANKAIGSGRTVNINIRIN